MVKQIIVIRKDLKMRRGKEIAQGSHSSMKWLADRVKAAILRGEIVRLFPEEMEWLNGKFTKICLVVNSEEELMEVKKAAEEAGVHCDLIVDSGATEFGGVPTPTCLALGPALDEVLDPITGNLKLY